MGSVFIQALLLDKITVESRRAGLDVAEGVRWISGGTGEFEVQNIEKATRGMNIILHLRDDALDYLESYKVKQIINKYSDHIKLANRNAERSMARGRGR